MCEPVTLTALAGIAVSAAGAAVTYEGQRQAASSQADFARASYAANDAANQVQQNQVNEQATQQMSERSKQAMQERGHLMAAMADNGLGGNSFVRGVNDTFASEGADIATIESNRRGAESQIQRSREAGTMNTNSQLASIRQPSLVGAGLQVAGSYIDTWRPHSRLPSIPNG